MGGDAGTTYRRPSVSIGMGLDGADYSYLTKKSADSTGFFITFNVPFKRTDIFAELLNDNGQLGADGVESGITYTILKPGREAGKLVRARPAKPNIARARARLGARRPPRPLPPTLRALLRLLRARAGLERMRARGGLRIAGLGADDHGAARD